MQALLGGKLHRQELGDWWVSWESRGPYRHWCLQECRGPGKKILVVMFNPGSLSGEGRGLKRDTTLRVLREVCGPARLDPLVINLFDYAAASPDDLFANWHRKDGPRLVYTHLDQNQLIGVIYAYGDYEHGGRRAAQIRDRISLVKSIFAGLPVVLLPKNKSGTPKHPLSWQREKLKPGISQALAAFAHSADIFKPA